MTWFVNILYGIGFFVAAAVLGVPFLKSLGSGIRSNEHFAELLLRGVFAAFVFFLWFAFGDSLLSWFFGWFSPSGQATSNVAPAHAPATFASHPFLWFGHLFAYVPLIAAMAAMGVGSFLYAGNIWIGYVLKAVFLGTIAIICYWHLEGMELLVSWFV